MMTDNPSPPAIIGARLKDAREYRGFSREEIARYLRTTPSEVSNIENGSRPVTAAYIKRLAKLYSTTVEHLTGDVREEPVPESVRLLVPNPPPASHPRTATKFYASRGICVQLLLFGEDKDFH